MDARVFLLLIININKIRSFRRRGCPRVEMRGRGSRVRIDSAAAAPKAVVVDDQLRPGLGAECFIAAQARLSHASEAPVRQGDYKLLVLLFNGRPAAAGRPGTMTNPPRTGRH